MRKFLLILTFIFLWAGTVFADCNPGYTFVEGVPSDRPDIQCLSHSYPDGGINSNPDGDLLPGEWKTTWTSGNIQGTLWGIASCNSTAGSANPYSTADADTFDNSADASNSSNGHCWCMATGWTPSGGTLQSLSGAWVFVNSTGAVWNCSPRCTYFCVRGIETTAPLRTAIFDTVAGQVGNCVGNNISINWQNATGGTQESSTCTYGGVLTSPASAPVAPRGYVFTGWSYQ